MDVTDRPKPDGLDFGLSMEKALWGRRFGFAHYTSILRLSLMPFQPRTPLPAPNDEFGTNGTNQNSH